MTKFLDRGQRGGPRAKISDEYSVQIKSFVGLFHILRYLVRNASSLQNINKPGHFKIEWRMEK